MANTNTEEFPCATPMGFDAPGSGNFGPNAGGKSAPTYPLGIDTGSDQPIKMSQNAFGTWSPSPDASTFGES